MGTSCGCSPRLGKEFKPWLIGSTCFIQDFTPADLSKLRKFRVEERPAKALESFREEMTVAAGLGSEEGAGLGVLLR